MFASGRGLYSALFVAAEFSAMTANSRYLWEKEIVADDSWTDKDITPAAWVAKATSAQAWVNQ